MRRRKPRGFSTTKSIPFRKIATEIDAIEGRSMGELDYESRKRSSRTSVNATNSTVEKCCTARNSSMIATLASLRTTWAEYRGLVEYYRLAYNLHRLTTLEGVMEQSLTKTLAAKHKLSVPKVYRKYQATARVGKRSFKILQTIIEREGKKPLVAQWGGISLHWDIKAPRKRPSDVPGSGSIRARETSPRRYLRILWHHRRRGAHRGA